MQTSAASQKLATLDRECIAKSVLTFYAARLAGDTEACLACFSPAIVFEVVNATGLFRVTGRHMGLPAMRRSIDANSMEFEILENRVTDMLIDGERVAVRRQTKLRGRGSGVTRKVESFEYARVVDGLIVELAQYLDTAAVAEALGKSSHDAV